MTKTMKPCDIDRLSPVNLRCKAYRTAAMLAVVLWALITHYHFVRRGVINPFGPHELNSLFLSNKGFALTSLTMISLSVFLGPMAKWCKLCGRLVGYRREIGLVGAYLVILHVPVSLLLLPVNFHLNWYAEHLPALACGIISILLLTIIAVYSMDSARKRLGFQRWLTIQRLVYPAIGFAAAHYMLMGKPGNWVRWSQTLDTPLPPGTLVMTSIVLVALIARVFAIVADRPGA